MSIPSSSLPDPIRPSQPPAAGPKTESPPQTAKDSRPQDPLKERLTDIVNLLSFWPDENNKGSYLPSDNASEFMAQILSARGTRQVIKPMQGLVDLIGDFIKTKSNIVARDEADLGVLDLEITRGRYFGRDVTELQKQRNALAETINVDKKEIQVARNQQAAFSMELIHLLHPDTQKLLADNEKKG